MSHIIYFPFYIHDMIETNDILIEEIINHRVFQGQKLEIDWYGVFFRFDSIRP